MAKEEFEIRKKLLQINKGINTGTHDPVAALIEKHKEQEKKLLSVRSASNLHGKIKINPI